MTRRFAFAVALLTLALFAVYGPRLAKAGTCPPKDQTILADVKKLVPAIIEKGGEVLKSRGFEALKNYAKLLEALYNAYYDESATKEDLIRLKADLEKMASVNYQQAIDITVTTDFDHMQAALDEAYRAVQANRSLPLDSNADFFSDAIVRNAYEPTALTNPFSKRYSNPCANDGGTGWKTVIHEPINPDGETVYEWRYIVPYLMERIGQRLVIITAEDQTWLEDKLFDPELRDHVHGLEDHLNTMTAGVQCGSNVTIPTGGGTATYYLACADIYTGLSQETKVFGTSLRLPSRTQLTRIRQSLKSQVIAQMPLFQVRSMVNRLHFHMSRAPDLTTVYQRIPVAGTNQCLEVQGGSARSGTPVVLGTCNGTFYSMQRAAQTWVYDRDQEVIRNPALNTCLAMNRYVGIATSVVPIPGTAVVSEACDGSQYQQWTYDPDKQMVSNAFGTVLDILLGVLRVQTYNDSRWSQKFYADPYSRADPRVFDPAFYLALYYDLREAFGAQNYAAAVDHWLQFGMQERRMSSPAFDVGFYLEQNPDLQKPGTFVAGDPAKAVDHWLLYGREQGRPSSPVFDVSYYLGRYTDLQAAFGAQNYAAAVDHWLQFGITEGRRGSASFDPSYYLATNPDVAGAYGSRNYLGAIVHWLVFGRNEGRRGAP